MMKLPISPGWWLVYTGSIYFITAMADIFVYRFCDPELLQFVYCIVMSMPLWIPLLSRWVGVRLLWSKE
jgi:hypothetical protein